MEHRKGLKFYLTLSNLIFEPWLSTSHRTDDAIDQLVTFSGHIESIDGSTGYVERRTVSLHGHRRVRSEWNLRRSQFNAVGSVQRNDAQKNFATLLHTDKVP